MTKKHISIRIPVDIDSDLEDDAIRDLIADVLHETARELDRKETSTFDLVEEAKYERDYEYVRIGFVPLMEDDDEFAEEDGRNIKSFAIWMEDTQRRPVRAGTFEVKDGTHFITVPIRADEIQPYDILTIK